MAASRKYTCLTCAIYPQCASRTNAFLSRVHTHGDSLDCKFCAATTYNHRQQKIMVDISFISCLNCHRDAIREFFVTSVTPLNTFFQRLMPHRETRDSIFFTLLPRFIWIFFNHVHCTSCTIYIV